MEKKTLECIDKVIYHFLDTHCDKMPRRIGKMIAMYYADARIRKKYSHYIGIEMGEGTFANLGISVVPNDHQISVHIGNNVSIAPNVTFLCGTEPNNGETIRELEYIKRHHIYYEDIYIEDEVWLGTGVIIFPGVRIGKCSVIGAGSVVMNDVEAYSIYAGTPARKIRDLKGNENEKN